MPGEAIRIENASDVKTEVIEQELSPVRIDVNDE